MIADLPIYTESLALDFKQYLSMVQDKVLVKVECPIEVLEVREKIRGDRAIGVARRQFPTIHKFLQYDVTVDTKSRQPKEIAEVILADLKLLTI